MGFAGLRRYFATIAASSTVRRSQHTRKRRLAFRQPSTYVYAIECLRDGFSVHSERDKMSESVTNIADVENDILNYEIADEAVEAAAALLEGQAKTRRLPSVRVWIPAPPEQLYCFVAKLPRQLI